ncbi:MAG TPA: NPCBM/NEW2 domain-containing protein [Tepidisphaeraceae bacterium]|nr:NPCBM/NEW2 domain-containing protein [Tepidisphaeraceae bacterium]
MRKTDKKRQGGARKGKKGLNQAFHLENLETRQLMSTVNVTDFGATPNDGTDDRAAIQRAINASKTGDTIRFSGGTFNLSDELTVASDRTYLGENGAVLHGRGVNVGDQIKVQGNNVTFRGLTFESGGIFFEKSGGGRNTGIVIDNNTFKLNTSGDRAAAITFTSGLENSRITNNYFTGYQGSFGIYGYNYQGLTISNNQFVNISAGMHIDAFGGCGNLLVEQNYMTGLKGMGMEFQGRADGDVFQDNWYEHPFLSSNFHSNDGTMAYSLILAGSTNITIQRNIVIAPERPDGTGCRIGFEVGGDNCLIVDNYIDGVNNAVASNDGYDTSSVKIGNNLFKNYINNARGWLGGIRMNAVTILPGTVQGPNAQINSAVLARVAAHDVPQRNHRYGTSGTGTPAPDPTPDPAPTPAQPPSAPTGLLALATGATSVNLFWTDHGDDASGYKVQKSTDGKTWTQVASLGASAAGYTVTGLTGGTTYSFRVVAFNDAGNSNFSNTATARPTSFDASKGTYLSDMTPTSTKNGWGPVEKDMSNGEQPAGDGQAITLGTNVYAKGLGTHAGSEIHFNLGGKYATFVSDIGIDAETDGKGSVVFQILADGVQIYSSDTLTSADGKKSISVDVSGKQELVLIVTDAGDGTTLDHADWAGARLLPATSSNDPDPDPAPDQGPLPDDSTIDVPAKSGVVYLSDLTPTSATNGWGQIEKDMSVGEKEAKDGNTLSLAGKTYAKGLGVHSDSEVHYNLNGKYKTFTADIGIDDEVGNRGSVVFQVWGDGVLLYSSGRMVGATPTKSINVDVAGVKDMSLVVGMGIANYFDHADWANAQLSKAKPSVTYLSDTFPTANINGWGPVELDTSVGDKQGGNGNVISIGGQTYAKGLGVHSNSMIVYNLEADYKTFTADIGVDDEVGQNGSVTFQVWGDGVLLYDSGTMTGGMAAKTATVNVEGKDQLWLVVTNAGDTFDFDHADWGNARLAA